MVVVLLVLTFTADDNAPATDVLTEELIGVKPEEIDTVEMDRDTGGHIKMVRTDAAKNKWEIVEPFHAPADGTAVQAIVNALDAGQAHRIHRSHGQPRQSRTPTAKPQGNAAPRRQIVHR